MVQYYQKGITMQSTKTIDLLSLGNTIVDLEYKVDEEKLTELNIEKGSMTLIDKPKRDELQTLLGDNVHLCNGGSAANSIFVANLLGLKVHHLGIIGQDSLSEFVIKDYDASGISHSFEETKTTGDTGCCFVLITPDGERTMLTYLGVSNQFKSTSFMTPHIASAKRLFIEGYLVADDTCFDLIKSTIIPLAKNAQTDLVFTLSDAGLISFFKSRFEELIQLSFDVIFCNFQEAAAISGQSTIDEFKVFFSTLAKETIITDGENGAFIIAEDTVVHCPTTSITPIDTTGAGDSFAGTYLALRKDNLSIALAGEKANEISALVISNFGARPVELTHKLTA